MPSTARAKLSREILVPCAVKSFSTCVELHQRRPSPAGNNFVPPGKIHLPAGVVIR
jgi:hypothetical protein